MGLLVNDRIVVAGPLVNMAAAAVANAVAVFTLPAGQLVGAKSLKIHRVNLYNNAAGNTTVVIGTGAGAAFVALLPALDSLNGFFDSYGPETDLIEVESFATITAYPAALGVGTSIDIRLEVIVCG